MADLLLCCILYIVVVDDTDSIFSSRSDLTMSEEETYDIAFYRKVCFISPCFTSPMTLPFLAVLTAHIQPLTLINYTPRKLCLWEGILFSRCPSVHPSVRPFVRNVLFP